MDKKNEWSLEFAQYIKQGEPAQVEKTKAWETAIGLQDVDGLKPSKYLITTAKEHIEGKINIFEVGNKINQYYEQIENRKDTQKCEHEEADKVSVRIAEMLSENTFNFSAAELLNIHKRLFKDIYSHAGTFRDYNITKKEWVLEGDSVIYSSYESINDTLNYDLEQERNFSYKDLSLDESIKHLCRFTSNIWQIHPFSEGNTRTTAIFIIKYLRTFGFNVNNDIFAEYSWYFRNSLVRSNYKNFEKNIFQDTTFLEHFFYNLLTNSNYELKNRNIHIANNKSVENVTKDNYTLEEQAIINILKRDSAVTQDEMSKQLNKSLRTIKTRMIEMQEKGLIERINGKRNGKWIIKQ